MVTIKSYGTHECIWCGREKEGVELASDDKSFVGWLCFADLKRMLRLKSERGGASSSAAPDARHTSP